MMIDKLKKRSYEFGHFRVDPEERVLLRQGVRVFLPPKAFDALALLVENRGRVVKKKEFFEKIWPEAFVEPGSLSVLISLLRKALGETRKEQRCIETISKHGYRFAASVREVTDYDTGCAAEEDPCEERSEPTQKLRSIAVLPFKTLIAGLASEYLRLGMADALITRLSNICQIIVRPTSAIARYDDADRDWLAAGREMGADWVLDGYVQQANDRIRVTVQLLNTADGSPLWAERFDEKFTDIFVVQDSIAEQVARALMLRISDDEQKQLAKRNTRNPAAYEQYLKGRYFWNKRTEEDIRKAVDHFRQAIEIDPTYALAYVGLADCYVLFSAYGLLSPGDAYPRAEAAAVRAMKLDEQLAQAHATLGLVRYEYNWDWPAAEKELKRALELRPNYATAHHWYAGYLCSLERFDEGIREIKRARELDPLSSIINAKLGWFHYCARQYDLAQREVENGIVMDRHFGDNYIILAHIFEQKGMVSEAIAMAKKSVEIMGSSVISLWVLGRVLAVSGRRAEARQVLDYLEELSQKRYISPYYLALIHAGLGDDDVAFNYLEAAYSNRDGWLIWLPVEPMFDSLRYDRRLATLIERVRLSPAVQNAQS